MQPLLAALIQQSIIVALIANPRGYCATPLLQDPLTQRRLAAVGRVLDAVPSLHLPVMDDGEAAGQVSDRTLAGMQRLVRSTPRPPPHSMCPNLALQEVKVAWARRALAWRCCCGCP